jgi:hypothetical protein
MTELDLLTIHSAAFNKIVSEPEVALTTPIAGVTNMIQKVLIVDETTNPPTGDIHTVSYFVKDRGGIDEKAYFSTVCNHSAVANAVKIAAEAIKE